MNHKKTMIALAIAMMALIPMGIMMSNESDAGMEFRGDPWGDGFSNNSDGTLHIVLKNTEPNDVELTIIITEGDRELKRETFTIPADTDSYTVNISFRVDGVGSHDLIVTGIPASLFPTPPSGDPLNFTNVTINVSESIWTKVTTYVAIAVVALLVVIAAFLKMRSAPAKKPDTTFTELERQKETTAVKEEPTARRSSTTERRRYGSSEEQKSAPVQPKPAAPKQKPAEPPQEKKASSFTELDKQKKTEKKESPSKSKSSEEPKKLKYVSSRRK